MDDYYQTRNTELEKRKNAFLGDLNSLFKAYFFRIIVPII